MENKEHTNVKKIDGKSTGVVLEVTQAVKDSFKSETNDSVKRHIESLTNWREQSLKSAVMF